MQIIGSKVLLSIQEYVGFILAINEAVQGKKYSTLQPVNEKVKKVVHLLDQLDHFIDVSASIVNYSHSFLVKIKIEK